MAHPRQDELAAGELLLWYPDTQLDSIGDGNAISRLPANAGSLDLETIQGTDPTLVASGVDGLASLRLLDLVGTVFGANSGLGALADWTFAARLKIEATTTGAHSIFRIRSSTQDLLTYYEYEFTDFFGNSWSPDQAELPDATEFTITLTHDSANSTVQIYVNSTLLTSTTDTGARDLALSGVVFVPAYIDLLVGNIVVFPLHCDASQVAANHAWLQSLDPDYLGAVFAYADIYGMPAGSRVQMYQRPHAQQCVADYSLLVPADLTDTYVEFSLLESSTEVEHYWYHGTDPALAGKTGHSVSLAGATDGADIAAAIATVLNALTYCEASSNAEFLYWNATENGQIAAPFTTVTDLAITELASGGTSTDLVAEESSTSGPVTTLLYSIARPEEYSIAAAHPDRVTTWLRASVTNAGLSLPTGVMLGTIDESYRSENDPGWTEGVDWDQDDATRELTLATVGRLDQLYYEVKYRQLNDTNGLQPEPFLEPSDIGADAFRLRNCSWSTGSVAYIRDDGFTIVDSDQNELEAWPCIRSGVSTLEGTAYYTTGIAATPVDAQASGAVNQSVQIRDGGSLDVDRIELFARPWGKEWSRVSTEELGRDYLMGQRYDFGLTPVVDLTSSVTARATVATWSDVTVTFGAAVEATHDWAISIDGGGRTGAQVDERCAYLTDEDQTATLDGTQGRVYRGSELYLPYTGAGGFTEGLTVTGGTSGASARIVADHGDALTLRRTATGETLDFSNGETITDTSTGTATAGTAVAYAVPRGRPLCHLEGDTLVGAPGVWIENTSGSIRLYPSEGGTYSPPISTTVTVHAVTSDDTDVSGARVYVKAAAGGSIAEGTVLLNALTDANGEASFAEQLSVAQPIVGWVRKASASPLYQEGPIPTQSITPGVNLNIAVTMVPDE